LQLHWLLQITKAINYNLPADQLYRIYETVLKDHFNVGKSALFVQEQEWKKVMAYGMLAELEEIKPEKFLEEISSSKTKNIATPSWLKADESVIPVYHNERLLAYAIIGNIASNDEFSAREIVPFIHTITNIIVVAIENKRLSKEAISQAAMKKELELAAEMQEMLFPVELKGNDLFDVDALYLPHQQVGGDYYDFISINNEEHIFCMADVSGKGMAAALLMSNFQANLHALIRTTKSLKELITELNTCVNKIAKGEKYITFFIGIINFATRKVQYVNAGHNPPVLHDGASTRLLDKGTTGLGMFDDLPFINEGEDSFEKGATVFLYTDGVTELENDNGEFFGIEKLKEFIAANNDVLILKSFHKNLISVLDRFRQNASYNDDVTVLTLRSLS
jgi:sigma-B regulation protein RsbU (phosphoserine phosphatase)